MKSWNPGRQTVELRPSRIRREPVRTPAASVPRSREGEMRNAVIGVALIAAASTAVVVGLVEITSETSDTPVPVAAAFDFCRTRGGANCVIDGQSFRMNGQVIALAGIDAPDIHPSRCSEEARLGVSAAVRLRDVLNRGPLTVSGRGSAADGSLLRMVAVGGRDVGEMLVASGAVRELGPSPRDWCEAASAG